VILANILQEANAGGYGAQSAVVSTKGTILWATSHSRTTGNPGYITGFELTETGMIYKTIFQVPTPTSGGRSNNVVACPTAENVIALTEAEQGSVSIWKYVNGTAHNVASVAIKDSTSPNTGCCSDAVWLD
jgi:carboxy-cis,cis-muconate cyclase